MFMGQTGSAQATYTLLGTAKASHGLIILMTVVGDQGIVQVYGRGGRLPSSGAQVVVGHQREAGPGLDTGLGGHAYPAQP